MKKRISALALVLIIVLLASCQTGAGDGTEQTENAIYTQTITLCALSPEKISSLEDIVPLMSQRLEHMGYGGNCSVNGEDVALTVTSDHEIMRDERDDIIRRLCTSGELTFDDSDGEPRLTRADFESVSCRFDERYYIDVTLKDESMPKYAELVSQAFEKWQSVNNFIALSCDDEVLAKVTVSGDDGTAKTVSFSGLLTKDDAEWIVYAYENPLPTAFTDKNKK